MTRNVTRTSSLVHEALMFGTVGVVNTVVNFAIFNALILTVLPGGPLKANVIATLLALTLSFLMNRHWTYRNRARTAIRREYSLYFTFNGIGLAIELGVLALATYGFGFHSIVAINAAKLLGLALGTAFRFWSYRTFVFKAQEATIVPLRSEDRSAEAVHVLSCSIPRPRARAGQRRTSYLDIARGGPP